MARVSPPIVALFCRLGRWLPLPSTNYVAAISLTSRFKAKDGRRNGNTYVSQYLGLREVHEERAVRKHVAKSIPYSSKGFVRVGRVPKSTGPHVLRGTPSILCEVLSFARAPTGI